MAKKQIPEDEVIKLSKDIASRAVDEVMRAMGGSPHPGLGHQCEVNRFECMERYDCTAPDSCTIEISCPKIHHQPK